MKLILLGGVLVSGVSMMANSVESVLQTYEVSAQFQLMQQNTHTPYPVFDNGFGETIAFRSITELEFEHADAQFHIQGQQAYLEPNEILPHFNKNEFRVVQINNENNNFTAQIDRANISFATGEFEWVVGRQPLSVGVARMANISQIYQATDFNWLSSGYGYGVDAINVNYYFGTNAVVNSVVLINNLDDSQNNMAYVKYKTMLLDQDVSVSFQKTKTVYSINSTIDAYAGNHAVWAEASLFWFDDESIKPNNNFRATMGVDYAYKDLYGQVEYHFNGLGCKHISKCTQPPIYSEYQYTGQALSANHYLFLNNNYPVTDLSNLTVVNIVNVLDPAIMNQAIWSVSQNDHFEYSLMLSNSVVLVEDELKPLHEFSLVPLMGAVIFQFYF